MIIIAPLCSSWSLEVVLLYKDDGHILSIGTAEGYLLSLVIQNKIPKFLLVGDELSGPKLEEDDLTELVLIDTLNNHILASISLDTKFSL